MLSPGRSLAVSLLFLALVLAACATTPAPMPILPPPTTRTVAVVDTYHGVDVKDPYRWLEDLDAPDVRTWIAAQNAATDSFLARIPGRDALRARLTELWNYERRSPPKRAGARWAWHRNDGLQAQAVLCIGDTPGGAGRVLLDPNTMSKDGTVALGPTVFSEDGRWLAYGMAAAGSDWTEWQVLEVDTGRVLEDRLRWTKFTSAAWTHDHQGFFYMRYPAPKEGEVMAAQNLAPDLCYHRLGTAQETDRVVYARPDEPTWGFAPLVTEDGRFLVIHIWSGTDSRNRIAWVDLTDPDLAVVPLLMEFDASWVFVTNEGTRFVFQTNLDAPRGRVVGLDLAQPERSQQVELIAHGEDTLEGTSRVGDRLVLTYLRDAANVVRTHRLDGTFLSEWALPSPCSVSGVDGRAADREVFVSVTSFLQPASLYRFDLGNDELREHWRPELAFDPGAFEARQVFYQGLDGQRIPMVVVHKKGLRLDGQSPTYLYGYGGFNVSLSPAFAPSVIAWLERGGVFAQPNLRGGGEYGEDWHRAGMRERKQVVFDDFAAAARYLIRNGYTDAQHLGIGGGSNGGLLVGAMLTQHQDLFAAAVPEVGVLDMLRYHRFTIGWAWASEYGTADDREMFAVLRAYSPLHNLRPHTHYPATLVMTGDHDDRVLPAHSYKFAAALQAAQAGPAPVLIRIETRAGHGAGKPTHMQIAAATDQWAFLHATLGSPSPGVR